MENDKSYTLNQNPFETNILYDIYLGNNQNGTPILAKFYSVDQLMDSRTYEAVQYNQAVFGDLTDQIYPQLFHGVNEAYSTSKGIVFITDVCLKNLQQHLQNKTIEQEEAKKILSQCIKSIFSLYLAGFWDRNIRPQHFVKVGDKWKLASIVYDENFKVTSQSSLEIMYDPKFQPPQVYASNNFDQQSWDQKMVWNLGSLFLDLLAGHHVLADLKTLDKFKNSLFDFSLLNLNLTLEEQYKKKICKMLHYNPTERMTLQQMFRCDLLCKQVAEYVEKHGIIRKMRIYVPEQSMILSSINKHSKISVPNSIDKFKFQEMPVSTPADLTPLKLTGGNRVNIQEEKNTKKNQNHSINMHIITESFSPTQQTERLHNSNQGQQLTVEGKQTLNIIRKLKNMFDQSQILINTSKKIKQNENLFDVQIRTLTQYALTFISLSKLHEIAGQLKDQDFKSRLKIKEKGSNLNGHRLLQSFEDLVSKKITQRTQSITTLKTLISSIPPHQIVLLQHSAISAFTERDPKRVVLQKVKQPYRKILKTMYDIVRQQHSLSKSDIYARLGMLLTYCMAIDKFHIQGEQLDNFTPYLQWKKKTHSNGNYICLQQFCNYVQTVQAVVLISHSAYVLKKYFVQDDNSNMAASRISA